MDTITPAQAPPLYVDLDGTLMKSDVLVESFFSFLKESPLLVFKSFGWLLGGKANLKQQIAQYADLDVALLPYNEELLKYLRLQKKAGRKIILATASNEKYANQIAKHLGVFDDVLASTGDLNLAGDKKVRAIEEHCQQRPFAYAGNGKIDIPVWKQSNSAVTVNLPDATVKEIQKDTSIEKSFNYSQNTFGSFLKAIRVYQWSKNFLLLVPLITSHRFTEPATLLEVVLAFLAFSSCASSVYLINDLLDLSADREHPRKRNRPFASGSLALIVGALTVPLLLLMSFSIAVTINGSFVGVLSLYFLVTLSYSLFLKQIVLVDILVLTSLYIMRVIAGAIAGDIALSFWLLAFSMFIFLSLALIKRCAELLVVKDQNLENQKARDYQIGDLQYVTSMGIASGYLAVLVMAMYIQSQAVVILYNNPTMLWMICPLLLYWISRMWLLTGRGEMHDDPLVFTLKDRHSHIVALFAAIIMFAAF